MPQKPTKLLLEKLGCLANPLREKPYATSYGQTNRVVFGIRLGSNACIATYLNERVQLVALVRTERLPFVAQERGGAGLAP